MKTEPQASVPAATPQRHLSWLVLFHSQEADAWAVSVEEIVLGAAADDARVEVRCFGTKQEAEAYIARFTTDADDDDDDEPDPEIVAELEKLLKQENPEIGADELKKLLGQETQQ